MLRVLHTTAGSFVPSLSQSDDKNSNRAIDDENPLQYGMKGEKARATNSKHHHDMRTRRSRSYSIMITKGSYHVDTTRHDTKKTQTQNTPRMQHAPVHATAVQIAHLTD